MESDCGGVHVAEPSPSEHATELPSVIPAPSYSDSTLGHEHVNPILYLWSAQRLNYGPSWPGHSFLLFCFLASSFRFAFPLPLPLPFPFPFVLENGKSKKDEGR